MRVRSLGIVFAVSSLAISAVLSGPPTTLQPTAPPEVLVLDSYAPPDLLYKPTRWISARAKRKPRASRGSAVPRKPPVVEKKPVHTTHHKPKPKPVVHKVESKKAPAPRPEPVVRAPTSTSVGAAQAYARALVSGTQYRCLYLLWMKESGWRWNADNPSSSAYGIPQALPGSKMASAGIDWRTNPRTQIRWGLAYIKSRYGTPCNAWAHSTSHGWY